jgi:hypothetical protein
MRAILLTLFFSWLLPLSGGVFAAPRCAATVAELRLMLGDAGFPQAWEETSMADGKPLRVSILEKDGALLLEFIKTGQGLWAQSEGVVCLAGSDFDIRFSAQQIRMGPAAGWLLRLALGNGGVFTLSRPAPEKLHIQTAGWSGTFVPTGR